MTGIDIKKTPPELTKELLDKALAAIREEQIIKAYDEMATIWDQILTGLIELNWDGDLKLIEIHNLTK